VPGTAATRSSLMNRNAKSFDLSPNFAMLGNA